MSSADLTAPPALSDLDAAALFLDFDGTLVEIADNPDGIVVPDRLAFRLAELADRLSGRLAVISGRSLGDLETHLGRLPTAAAGSHGGEMKLPGGEVVRNGSCPSSVRSAAGRFVDQTGGLLLESKPLGLAIHYRQAPEREVEVIGFVERMAEEFGLKAKRGKMVAELIAHDTDKGEAVAKFMAEPAFAGSRPIFIGDDVTDEDGFLAAASGGGFGILVGEPRETAARYLLPDTPSVYAWLGL
ncbi:trehalose-phosphatase [Pacificimonas flava]|uniref:Trehalose 6-phosphate phosphatase n=3 Tax=Sphingosinicellaceae TaxID=2820280 RepID=A0A219B165_9SPHN|nr:trehalose-phosphatase [Pacificimonas aurantium]OWV32081.1 trehalose-phosphatase [Pacificimonas flava]